MRTSAVTHSTKEVAGHILAASHILATEEAARHILALHWIRPFISGLPQINSSFLFSYCVSFSVFGRVSGGTTMTLTVSECELMRLKFRLNHYWHCLSGVVKVAYFSIWQIFTRFEWIACVLCNFYSLLVIDDFRRLNTTTCLPTCSTSGK